MTLSFDGRKTAQGDIYIAAEIQRQNSEHWLLLSLNYQTKDTDQFLLADSIPSKNLSQDLGFCVGHNYVNKQLFLQILEQVNDEISVVAAGGYFYSLVFF